MRAETAPIQESSPQQLTYYGLVVDMAVGILEQDIPLAKADIRIIADFFGLPPQETAEIFQQDISPTGRIGSVLREADPEHQIGLMSGEFFHLELGQAATYNSDQAEAAMVNAFDEALDDLMYRRDAEKLPLQDFSRIHTELPARVIVTNYYPGRRETNVWSARNRAEGSTQAQVDPIVTPKPGTLFPHLQRVLDACQSGMTIDEIVEKLSIPRQRLHAYRSMLKQRGFSLSPNPEVNSPIGLDKPTNSADSVPSSNGQDPATSNDTLPATSLEDATASSARKVRLHIPQAPESRSTEDLGERDKAIIAAYLTSGQLKDDATKLGVTIDQIRSRIAYLKRLGYDIPSRRTHSQAIARVTKVPPQNHHYEPFLPRIFEEPSFTNENPDTISDAERIAWEYLSSGAPLDGLKTALTKQLGLDTNVSESQLYAIQSSLAKKGIFPGSDNQLPITDRLYGKEIAQFLQLVQEQSSHIAELFPNIASHRFSYAEEHTLTKVIQAANYSNTNIRPSLRQNVATDEAYVRLLITKVQNAFQTGDRNRWLQVFTVPERLRVDALNILDWLHTYYVPLPDTVNLPIAG